jgi:glycosyltransferase involved in cell wall biosynthesis
MRIGFDAKRIFNNATGLGNYGRTLLHSLASGFPEHAYYLFTPRASTRFQASRVEPIEIVQPAQDFSRVFSSAWRSKFMTHDIRRLHMDLYHGLSNEIPFGIHRLDAKLVVTVHDVIFERYPGLYNPIDVCIYRQKVRYACRRAHRIIAVSEQTRLDLITYYRVDAGKIQVVYPGCDPVFGQLVPRQALRAIRHLFSLPKEFLLYVGAVVERKNLLSLVKALEKIPESPPLVVVGYGNHYKQKVKRYLSDRRIEDKVVWLSEKHLVLQAQLPAVYRLAKALIYPSVFEGFGIPIQEAMWSGTPVITSSGSCFAETGGNAAIYVNPLDAHELAEAIYRVCNDSYMAADMIRKGTAYVRQFNASAGGNAIMDVYTHLVS